MADLKKERFTGSLGAALKFAGFTYATKTWVWSGFFSGNFKVLITTIFVGIFLTLFTLSKLGKKLGNKKPFEYYLLSIGMPFLLAQFVLAFIVLGAFSEASKGQPANTVLLLAFLVSWGLLGYFQFRTWKTLYEITGFNLLALAIKWGVVASVIGMELKWILFPFGISTFRAAILFSLLLLIVANALQIVAFLKLPYEAKFDKCEKWQVE